MVDCDHIGSIIPYGGWYFSLEPANQCDPATNSVHHDASSGSDKSKTSQKVGEVRTDMAHKARNGTASTAQKE